MVYFTPETTPGLGQTELSGGGGAGIEKDACPPQDTHTRTVPLALSTKGLCLVPPAMTFPT